MFVIILWNLPPRCFWGKTRGLVKKRHPRLTFRQPDTCQKRQIGHARLFRPTCRKIAVSAVEAPKMNIFKIQSVASFVRRNERSSTKSSLKSTLALFSHMDRTMWRNEQVCWECSGLCTYGTRGAYAIRDLRWSALNETVFDRLDRVKLI